VAAQTGTFVSVHHRHPAEAIEVLTTKQGERVGMEMHRGVTGGIPFEPRAAARRGQSMNDLFRCMGNVSEQVPVEQRVAVQCWVEAGEFG
jgi:hypothetical protein